MVVCSARSLLAGGCNLHSVGGEYYANVRAVNDCAINRLDDVYPRRTFSSGARQHGEERAREEGCAVVAQDARNRPATHFPENPPAHHDRTLRRCRAVQVEGGPEIRRDRLGRSTLDVLPFEHVH